MAYTRFKTVNFGATYSGLSTVGYKLVNANGTVNTARATAGVTERATGSGIYGVLASLPSGFQGEILWDTGGNSPVYASEPVNPGEQEYQDVANSAAVVLASNGLDGISVTAPTGAAATFPQMLVQLWRRFFRKTALSSGQLQTFADNGTTVLTTQTVTTTSTSQTVGAA